MHPDSEAQQNGGVRRVRATSASGSEANGMPATSGIHARERADVQKGAGRLP
jgi:hypothetical protein